MRLEHDKDASGKMIHRPQCCGDLVGVVAEIVYDRDAVHSADNVKPAQDAPEGIQCLSGVLQGYPAGHARCDSGKRI